MNRSHLKSEIAALAIALVASASAYAQTVAVGLYPIGSYSGGPFDTINNGNLNAHFAIPVVSKAGPTLPFQYALAYDSTVWYPAYVNGVSTWTPVNAKDWGWSAAGEGVGTGGYVSYFLATYSCLVNPGNPHPVYFNWYDSLNFVYHDSAGGVHPFGIAVTTFPPSGAPCGSDSNPNSATGVARDHSGYSLSTTSTPSGTITGQQGIKFNVPFFSGVPAPSTASEVNPNGNTISSSVAGQTTSYTDALGMTVLSATSTGSPTTQETYKYSAVGNVQAQVVVKYSTYTVRTNFGCTGSSLVHEFGPTSENLVSEIDMPDISTNPSDKYTFTYEPTPVYSTDTTGRLAMITLPTGGTITYAYSGGSNGIECSDGSTATLTRTLSPGGAWTYTHTNVSSSEWQTTLSDPKSNVTTMKFQFATAALAYETERDLPGGAATILTCYNGNPSPCTNSSDTTAILLPITRQTVMNTLGSNTSEVDTLYDGNGYGLPTDVKEYDWGASALLRETVTAYDYNTSCGIPSGSAIVGQPCTVTLNGYNGQAQWTPGLSSASNTYDSNGNLLATSSGGLTKDFSYNSNGTVATATDVNSKITTYAYNGTGGCSVAYPTSVTGPAPSSLMVSMQWDCYAGVTTSVTDPNSKLTSFGYDNMDRVKSTSYPDGGSVTATYSPTQTQTITKITSGVSRTDTTNLEGFGRVSSQIVAGVETDNTYDSLGRFSTVSIKNSNQNDTYSYDSISRLNKITHADTSYSQASYPNNCVTITDESSKVRQMCIDGLGRTNKVTEDPAPGLNYTTTYAYDGFNDPVGVIQGTQQTCQINSVWYSRCFQYDSLSRTTQATTPESGTVNYTYDSDSTCGNSNGDMVKRVDARGIRTCYAYDFIHRLISKTYNDTPTTPTANYSYDQSSYNGLTITNGKGRQTGMSDGSGETAWSFDPVGRMVSQEKTISGVTRTIGYSYNYDGSTAAITYPSGRVITYGVDSLGRPGTAEDVANVINYVTGTCSGSACYAPQNALQSIVTGKTGSFAGTTYSLGYNSRLLPSTISAYTATSTALNLSYNYYPNGNVETITNLQNSGRTATYGYDSLNRINSASSQATSGADCWGQSVPSNGYDPYGNLLTINSSQCTTQSLSLGVNSKNQITGYGYDSSGDETGDGTYTYAWDAESRMKSGAGVNYTFDGSGERVADSSPKLFWYGQDGFVLGETDTSGNTSNEYIFFDGMRIARRDSSGNVYYYFGNALGSSVITTATSSICYDADFYPFGWELVKTNTCAQNYKFVGMERDSASGLDRTIFRQYSSNYGRWLSPDPYYGSYDLTNPQSFNRYAYVMNRPLRNFDPFGLCDFSGDGGTSYINGDYGATTFTYDPTPCGGGAGGASGYAPLQDTGLNPPKTPSAPNNPQNPQNPQNPTTKPSADDCSQLASDAMAAQPTTQPGFQDLLDAFYGAVFGYLMDRNPAGAAKGAGVGLAAQSAGHTLQKGWAYNTVANSCYSSQGIYTGNGLP